MRSHMVHLSHSTSVTLAVALTFLKNFHICWVCFSPTVWQFCCEEPQLYICLGSRLVKELLCRNVLVEFKNFAQIESLFWKYIKTDWPEYLCQFCHFSLGFDYFHGDTCLVVLIMITVQLILIYSLSKTLL